MKRIKLEHIRSLLLDLVLDHSPFSKILAAVYRETQLPTIAFDVSFNLIAYSFERPFSVYGWELLAAEGSVSENLVLSNNYLQLEESILSNRASLIVYTAGNAELKTAFGPVFKDNILVGYVATMLLDTDANDVLALNDLICQTLSLDYTDCRLSSDGKLGIDILLENQVNGASASLFAERHKSPYVTAVVRAVASGSATLNYIKSRIDSLSDCFSAVDTSDNLRIMFTGVSSEAHYKKIRSSLEEICMKYDCRAGLSDRIDSLSHISVGITQSRICMQLIIRAHPELHLISFPDSYTETVALALITSGDFDAHYYMQHIERITELSPKKSVSLLETLSAYFDNGFDAAAAASALGIHKNSVVYRLKRISEICSVDLSDGRQAAMLIVELALRETNERMKGIDVHEQPNPQH